jgi:DNA (cytosine-5)-methyltransferase 1
MNMGRVNNFHVPTQEEQDANQAKLQPLKAIFDARKSLDTSLLDKQREYMMASFDSGGGKRGILHRLSNSKPCLTLLCTPSQKQTERCHPTEIRPLRIREYARIQSFDDSYEFIGSMASKYKQIGNAVPVNLAYAIGKQIVKALNGYYAI